MYFEKNVNNIMKYNDLKAQMQDKNIAISELKKLIEKCKGKSVETQFDKPSVVRQPNAQRIPKPSVLGKPTPFSNSPKMRSFQNKTVVNKTNVSDGLFNTRPHQNFASDIRKQRTYTRIASKTQEKAKKSVAKPPKKTFASDTTIRNQDVNIRSCTEIYKSGMENGGLLRDVHQDIHGHKKPHRAKRYGC
ncbi:hypothetical protein Tco_0077282 [Tanacetum coccineum]